MIAGDCFSKGYFVMMFGKKNQHSVAAMNSIIAFSSGPVTLQDFS